VLNCLDRLLCCRELVPQVLHDFFLAGHVVQGQFVLGREHFQLDPILRRQWFVRGSSGLTRGSPDTRFIKRSTGTRRIVIVSQDRAVAGTTTTSTEFRPRMGNKGRLDGFGQHTFFVPATGTTLRIAHVAVGHGPLQYRVGCVSTWLVMMVWRSVVAWFKIVRIHGQDYRGGRCGAVARASPTEHARQARRQRLSLKIFGAGGAGLSTFNGAAIVQSTGHGLKGWCVQLLRLRVRFGQVKSVVIIGRSSIAAVVGRWMLV
jgi:hypothetical protein